MRRIYGSEEIDEFLKGIKNTLDSKDCRIEYLQEENERLKSEQYKDEELSKMREYVEKVDKDMNRGFPISEREEQRIKEWKLKHEVEDHGLDTPDKRLKAQGCCGGAYTYSFIPTSIGTIGVVKCSCGKEFEFQKL